MRERTDVLRCRPRERDAVGGPVSASAAFFSTSASRGYRALVSSKSWTQYTSPHGTARPLGIADAVPARQNMEEAAVGDNPGRVPPWPSTDPDRRVMSVSVPLGSRPGARHCAGSQCARGIAALARLAVCGAASAPPAGHMASSSSSSPVLPAGSSHLSRRAQKNRNRRRNGSLKNDD